MPLQLQLRPAVWCAPTHIWCRPVGHRRSSSSVPAVQPASQPASQVQDVRLLLVRPSIRPLLGS